MEITNQEAYLLEKLNKAIEKIDAGADRQKKWAYRVRYAVLGLSALSTILLGLDISCWPGYLPFSRNAALVLGAANTFVVGLAAFWNVEMHWLKQKLIFSHLRELREQYKFLKAKTGSLSEADIDGFFTSYQKLMNEQTEYWSQRADPKSNSVDRP